MDIKIKNLKNVITDYPTIVVQVDDEEIFNGNNWNKKFKFDTYGNYQVKSIDTLLPDEEDDCRLVILCDKHVRKSNKK